MRQKSAKQTQIKERIAKSRHAVKVDRQNKLCFCTCGSWKGNALEEFHNHVSLATKSLRKKPLL